MCNPKPNSYPYWAGRLLHYPNVVYGYLAQEIAEQITGELFVVLINHANHCRVPWEAGSAVLVGQVIQAPTDAKHTPIVQIPNTELRLGTRAAHKTLEHKEWVLRSQKTHLKEKEIFFRLLNA